MTQKFKKQSNETLKLLNSRFENLTKEAELRVSVNINLCEHYRLCHKVKSLLNGNHSDNYCKTLIIYETLFSRGHQPADMH